MAEIEEEREGQTETHYARAEHCFGTNTRVQV